MSEIKRLADLSSLFGDYAGHSFRSGGACDLWAANVPLDAIKQWSRWKSDAVRLYLRDGEDTAIKIAQAFKLASEFNLCFWDQDASDPLASKQEKDFRY